MGGTQSTGIETDIWRPRPRNTFPSASELEKDGSIIRGKGSRVHVYKQDPTVKMIGYREMWLLENVRIGPSTPYLAIKGMPTDYGPSDLDNNYLYRPNMNEEAFDAVHTLAVVSHVHWMYRRALKRVGSRRELSWHFDGPIEVHPLAGLDANAYYDRQEKALKFFYFDDDDGNRIKNCRSWDVVAHETGHAILDALQPNWVTNPNPESGALHESFGDITAILSLLDQMDMCEAIVTHSKGNLRDRNNMLAVIAEEFAGGVGKSFGLRNAAVDLTISRATTEIHDFSRVFTGAVYDILVALFERSLDIDKNMPAEALYFAARHVLSLFLVAIMRGPKRRPTFRAIAQNMIQSEPEDEFKEVIRHEFTRREIFYDWAKPKVEPFDMTDGNGKKRNLITCTTLAEMRKRLTEGPEEGADFPDGFSPQENDSSKFSVVSTSMVVLVGIAALGFAWFWMY